MFSTNSRAATTSTAYRLNNNKLLEPSVATSDYNPLNLRYPLRLNFYNKPPDSEITIEEFETWAIDRLKILAEIENSASRNKTFDELKTVLNSKSKEYLPLLSNKITARSAEFDFQRRKDHYSHFILRLAFCRSEELRNRFVNAETQLFRYRLETEDTQEKEYFIKSLNLDWKEATTEEMSEIRRLFTKDGKYFGEEGEYYKVRWTRVPDLVSSRRVYVSGGFAFVASKDQASIILQEFSTKLLKALEVTSKHVPYMEEDSRLLPVLEHLSLSFLAGVSGSDFVSSNLGPDSGKFTADMIDSLAKEHFPPCMKHLWTLLRKDRHLKYGGRQQLNLFLKGIGLPIEEAIIFWQKAFAKTSEEKFRKEYKYGIRHNYGLEGSRKNYQPKSCVAIITGSVGPQESHGCPFKEFSQNNLTQYLNQIYKLDSKNSVTKDILEFKKSQNYHLACTCLWEHEHRSFGAKKGDGLGQGETVAHPNRFFEASYLLKTHSESAPQS